MLLFLCFLARLVVISVTAHENGMDQPGIILKGGALAHTEKMKKGDHQEHFILVCVLHAHVRRPLSRQLQKICEV
jgi:hypothetical protein